MRGEESGGRAETVVARKPRQNVPGIHHVYARGIDRRVLFADDHDRTDYLVMLGQVVGKLGWSCLAYCLMGNHVHLLIEVEEPTLSSGIQRLHGLYAAGFNARHGLTGHVFERRFGSTLVTSDPQLWWTIAYIAHNPVEAGLCRSPEAWPWSSHGAVLADRGPWWLDRPRLLRCFEGLGGEPRRRYLQLTAGGGAR